MLKLARLWAAFLIFGLLGCVQTDIVVKVNPDGGGTLEETVLMKKEFTDQIRATAQGLAAESGGEAPGPVELWKEADIRAKASQMGEGVKFEKMELLDREGFEGYRAVYSFPDVNNLFVNQNPGAGAASGGAEAEQKKKELIRFKFTKGQPSSLTIYQPGEPALEPAAELSEKAEGAEKPAEDQGQKEMMMNMMKMMMAGMRLSVAVEVEGEVVESNAAHREGPRVTVMELDFDRLIESAEDFEKFSQANPGSVGGAKELMKDIPGVKVEPEREIRILFQ